MRTVVKISLSGEWPTRKDNAMMINDIHSELLHIVHHRFMEILISNRYVIRIIKFVYKIIGKGWWFSRWNTGKIYNPFLKDTSWFVYVHIINCDIGFQVLLMFNIIIRMLKAYKWLLTLLKMNNMMQIINPSPFSNPTVPQKMM